MASDSMKYEQNDTGGLKEKPGARSYSSAQLSKLIPPVLGNYSVSSEGGKPQIAMPGEMDEATGKAAGTITRDLSPEELAYLHRQMDNEDLQQSEMSKVLQ